jgi:hypothetical protein
LAVSAISLSSTTAPAGDLFKMNSPGAPAASIAPVPAYIEHLKALVHDEQTLQRAGYVRRPLSAADIARKKRCENCRRGE